VYHWLLSITLAVVADISAGWFNRCGKWVVLSTIASFSFVSWHYFFSRMEDHCIEALCSNLLANVVGLGVLSQSVGLRATFAEYNF